MQTRRRDLITLPLIGLLTITIICVAAELIARRHFTETPTSMDPCLDVSDRSAGIKGVPNTVCHQKALETDDIVIRLDSRGYRSDTEIGTKDPSVYRIVLIGSSIAMGERAQSSDSPAGVLAPRLATLSARRIELYNEGMAYGFAHNAHMRFQDAIDLQPDLILWLLTPLDIARSAETGFEAQPLPTSNGIGGLKDSVLQYIRSHGGEIIIGQALRHYLYEMQSEDQYVRAALLGKSPDDESGFLLISQGPAWQQHWADFAGHAQDMFARARAAGIPMAAVFAPNRLQAAMLSQGSWPSGFDPYAIDHAVQRLVAADGGTFIDILSHFAAVPGTEHYYLPLDGHPTAEGYHFIADAIATELTGGAVAPLAAHVGPAETRP